jgi:hypothetical protein
MTHQRHPISAKADAIPASESGSCEYASAPPPLPAEAGALPASPEYVDLIERYIAEREITKLPDGPAFRLPKYTGENRTCRDQDPEMRYGTSRDGAALVNTLFWEALSERRVARRRYHALGQRIGWERIAAYLKRRKRVNLFDQKVARLLFFGRREFRWVGKIDGRFYSNSKLGESYLPIDVAEELGEPVAKVEAALARVARELTGKTIEQLIAEDEAEAARLAAIPVPEPNLPHNIRRFIRNAGPMPSWQDAVALVYQYCDTFRLGWPHEDPDLADVVAANRVAEHIEGRLGDDYRAVWRCVEVVLRGRPKSNF